MVFKNAFLWGLGLSLDGALAFWRAEFTKKMDPDKVWTLSSVTLVSGLEGFIDFNPV